MTRTYRPPTRHPSGAQPPPLPAEAVPGHVAVIMDGNGRWAKARGLPRTAGHTAGEHALFEVVEGALEIGVKHGVCNRPACLEATSRINHPLQF